MESGYGGIGVMTMCYGTELLILGGRVWNVIVNKDLNNWKVNEYETIIHLLPFVQASDERNCIMWKLTKNGSFSFKSYYHYLVGNWREGVQRLPASQIWKVQALSRIAFFAWETRRECILMIDNLMRRDRTMINGCYLCKKDSESCSDILLWCSVVFEFSPLWCII